jgi:hypothetical protein
VVECHLAKVDVAGSSPVSRSKNFKPDAAFCAGLFRSGAILSFINGVDCFSMNASVRRRREF